jgi:hypothetical protein
MKVSKKKFLNLIKIVVIPRRCISQRYSIWTEQQPEAYLAQCSDLFDEEANIKDGTTKDFIKKAVESYIDWFSRNA